MEPWRVQTDQRLRNALAISAIGAWRIHTITLAGRAYPATACAGVFAPREGPTLSMMQQHCHPPPRPPPRREMGRRLARLGGCFARQGEGEPGLKTIWPGDQRRHACIYAVDTYQTINGYKRSMG
jgi:hypothetical protein